MPKGVCIINCNTPLPPKPPIGSGSGSGSGGGGSGSGTGSGGGGSGSGSGSGGGGSGSGSGSGGGGSGSGSGSGSGGGGTGSGSGSGGGAGSGSGSGGGTGSGSGSGGGGTGSGSGSGGGGTGSGSGSGSGSGGGGSGSGSGVIPGSGSGSGSCPCGSGVYLEFELTETQSTVSPTSFISAKDFYTVSWPLVTGSGYTFSLKSTTHSVGTSGIRPKPDCAGSGSGITLGSGVTLNVIDMCLSCDEKNLLIYTELPCHDFIPIINQLYRANICTDYPFPSLYPPCYLKAYMCLKSCSTDYNCPHCPGSGSGSGGGGTGSGSGSGGGGTGSGSGSGGGGTGSGSGSGGGGTGSGSGSGGGGTGSGSGSGGGGSGSGPSGGSGAGPSGGSGSGGSGSGGSGSGSGGGGTGSGSGSGGGGTGSGSGGGTGSGSGSGGGGTGSGSGGGGTGSGGSGSGGSGSGTQLLWSFHSFPNSIDKVAICLAANQRPSYLTITIQSSGSGIELEGIKGCLCPGEVVCSECDHLGSGAVAFTTDNICGSLTLVIGRIYNASVTEDGTVINNITIEFLGCGSCVSGSGSGPSGGSGSGRGGSGSGPSGGSGSGSGVTPAQGTQLWKIPGGAFGTHLDQDFDAQLMYSYRNIVNSLCRGSESGYDLSDTNIEDADGIKLFFGSGWNVCGPCFADPDSPDWTPMADSVPRHDNCNDSPPIIFTTPINSEFLGSGTYTMNWKLLFPETGISGSGSVEIEKVVSNQICPTCVWDCSNGSGWCSSGSGCCCGSGMIKLIVYKTNWENRGGSGVIQLCTVATFDPSGTQDGPTNKDVLTLPPFWESYTYAYTVIRSYYNQISEQYCLIVDGDGASTQFTHYEVGQTVEFALNAVGGTGNDGTLQAYYYGKT